MPVDVVGLSMPLRLREDALRRMPSVLSRGAPNAVASVNTSIHIVYMYKINKQIHTVWAVSL